MAVRLSPASIIAGPPLVTLAGSLMLDWAGCTGLVWWQLWVACWLLITGACLAGVGVIAIAGRLRTHQAAADLTRQRIDRGRGHRISP